MLSRKGSVSAVTATHEVGIHRPCRFLGYLLTACVAIVGAPVDANDFDAAKAEAASQEANARTPKMEASSLGLVPLLVVDDLIKAGKFRDAEEALANWEKSGKEPAQVQRLRGQFENARQAALAFSEAETQANQAVNRREAARSLVARGIKSLAEKDLDQSESHFLDALALDADNYEAREGLARVQEARDSAGIDSTMVAYASENIGSPGAPLLSESAQASEIPTEEAALAEAANLFSEGFLAESEGDYEQAFDRYRQVLFLFPDSEDAEKRLLVVQQKWLEEQGTLQGMAEPKTVSLEVGKQVATAFDQGLDRFHEGDYSNARVKFQEVLNLIPDHPAARQYLAQCVNLEGATAVASGSTDPDVIPLSERGPVSPHATADVFADSTVATDNVDVAYVPVQVERGGAENWSQAESVSSPSSTEIPSNDPWHVGGSDKVLQEIAVEDGMTTLPSPVMESGTFGSPGFELAQAVVPAPPAETGVSEVPQVVPQTEGGQVEEYIQAGVRASQRGDIRTAYELWEKALELDPNSQAAAVFLEKYAGEKAEADRQFEAAQTRNEVDERVERELDERTLVLDAHSVSVNELLNTMAAIADLQIITGEGVDGEINAFRSTQQTYRQVLDRVLSLNGYSWRREPGTNLIYVTREIVSKRFPLSDGQYQALKRLAMGALGGKETDDLSDALREVILGKVEDRDIDASIPGRTFRLNKYLRELIVRDSKHNVELVEEFLRLYSEDALDVEEQPMLVETFRLPKSSGNNLAEIINLRLFGKAEFDTDFSDEDPYLVFDSDSGVLIVRHTPEKLDLVKRLMQDPQFIQDVMDRELKAKKFFVVPAEDLATDTPDALVRRRNQVRFTERVFRALLYGTRSIEESAAEGRVLYTDEEEGTIDVVDTPENLEKINDYLQNVSDSSTTQKIYEVRNRTANDLAYSMQGMVMAVIPSMQQPVAVQSTGGTGTTGGFTGGMQGGMMGGMGGMGMMGGMGGMGMMGGMGGMGMMGGMPGMGMMGGMPGMGMMGGLGGGMGGDLSGMSSLMTGGMLWVTLKADVATKKIIINSIIPSHGDQAYELLESLDVAIEQVEVEVRLVELRYTSSDALGITMTINNLLAIDDGGAGGPGFTLSGGSSVLTSQPNNPSGSTLTLATLGRTRVNATLTMLAQFTDLRILTAPKITGISGVAGNITVGESFPYVSGTDLVTQPGGGNAATTQTVETDSAEIGFELSVLPSVTGDGRIELDLAPSLETRGESLILFDAVGNPLQGEPIINTREATVRVRVNDGATLVIGGLLRREINHAEGRTPLFGFVPGLAPLFTDKEETEITQNLLILVTARIIKED